MNWRDFLDLPRRSDVAALTHRVEQQERKLMATIEAFEAEFKRVDEATNKIAKELYDVYDRLKDAGLSPEVEDAILAKLRSAAEKLEGIGKEPVASA